MTANKDKTVFVTGATGFIGRHLIDYLLHSGFRVRALVHRRPLPPKDGLEMVRGDICDRDNLRRALEGVSLIFHLASALGSSVISREEFRRTNAAGTECLLDEARRGGVGRVIHISSAGVFGAVKSGQVADERTPPDPITVYDKTKLEGERIAIARAGQGMDVIVLRPGWAYGPRDRRTFKLIRAICTGRFVMVTRGAGFQTPVYIDDLIKGVYRAAESGKSGEIYHLAGGQILTVREMVRTIRLACGKKQTRLFIPLLPARLAALILEAGCALRGKEAPLNRSKLSFFIHSKPLSIDKARSDLAFSPEVDFQSGISRTVSWYRSQGWLPPASPSAVPDGP
jgi:nucleoside-diphosphate-sugar epimerase